MGAHTHDNEARHYSGQRIPFHPECLACQEERNELATQRAVYEAALATYCTPGATAGQ